MKSKDIMLQWEPPSSDLVPFSGLSSIVDKITNYGFVQDGRITYSGTQVEEQSRLIRLQRPALAYGIRYLNTY